MISEKGGKIIDISMSDMQAAGNPHTLRSSGIGSCVVVTLYDPRKRVGAMAHPMLAKSISGSIENPLRFVESAIDAMLSALEGLGASKERLEAKIVGGANMFKVFDKNPDSIGIHNAEAAKKKLEREGIAIVANDTGGNAGRSVAFDLTSGFVEVKTKI
jgi:chemotaxis protein CheD